VDVFPLPFDDGCLIFDQPGAKGHPGQHLAILHLCPLCQSLVGTVGMETDRVAFPVEPTNRAASIGWVSDQRSSFESKRTSPTIRFALTSFERLQAVKLATV